jgi:hypothetical protein
MEPNFDDDGHDEAICDMIEAYQYYQRVLHVSFNYWNFRYEDVEQALSFPSASTHVTLRDLLDRRVFSTADGDNTNVYSWCDRYLLGLNLARSLFYLFDGPWGSTNWKTDEIFFLVSRNPGSETVHGRHRPYIRCSLSIDADRSQDQRNTKVEQLCYPMWLALAQVLVEVQIGRSLLAGGDAPPKNTELRQKLLELAKSELKDAENAIYREAIEACLNFGFKLLRIRGQARRKEERKLIWNDIVSKLERNYKKWSPAPPECMDLHFVSERQSQTPGRTATPPPEKEPTPSPLPPVYQPEGSPIRPIQRQASRPVARLPPGVSILTLFDDTDSNDKRYVSPEYHPRIMS